MLASDKDGHTIQGFSPNVTLCGEYTIGTSSAIDVTGRTAVRWSSQDGTTSVCRVLNSNSTGLTGLAGLDVLNSGITSVDFTGTAATVVEYELM